MEENDNFEKYFNLINDNYLVNAYKHIIKSKFINFIFTLIEILINILQELSIFINGYDFDSKNKFVNFIVSIPKITIGIKKSIKLATIIVYTIFFELLYLYLTKRKIKKQLKVYILLFNIIEFLFFRLFMLFYLDMIFSFYNFYLILVFVLFFHHIFFIWNHFLYNHLYYYVPLYIDYPFDEFSSIFDLILFSVKIILSLIINTKRINVKKCFYIVFFILQIIFCIFFIFKMINHSYLFMKNSFLNKTKAGLFFAQTSCLIFAELIGKKNIINISYLLIIILTIIIFIFSLNLIYEPKTYIKIRTETSFENLLFYFYIISEKNDITFLLKDKIYEHYEICGVCNLCHRFKKYLQKTKLEIIFDNKKGNVFNDKKNGDKNHIIDLFHILFEYKDNYFQLMNEIVLNYQYNNKIFINSSYYYINLSFLLFSQFKDNNITLSRNIKILLDIINKENKLIEKQESQIKKIIFCNEFISLADKILTKLKKILKESVNDIKYYVDLSVLLKEMKKPEYKDVLFNY